MNKIKHASHALVFHIGTLFGVESDNASSAQIYLKILDSYLANLSGMELASEYLQTQFCSQLKFTENLRR